MIDIGGVAGELSVDSERYLGEEHSPPGIRIVAAPLQHISRLISCDSESALQKRAGPALISTAAAFRHGTNTAGGPVVASEGRRWAVRGSGDGPFEDPGDGQSEGPEMGSPRVRRWAVRGSRDEPSEGPEMSRPRDQS